MGDIKQSLDDKNPVAILKKAILCIIVLVAEATSLTSTVLIRYMDILTFWGPSRHISNRGSGLYPWSCTPGFGDSGGSVLRGLSGLICGHRGAVLGLLCWRTLLTGTTLGVRPRTL